MQLVLFLTTFLASLTLTISTYLEIPPGTTAPIPSWNLQSSLHAPTNLSHLSLPSTNISTLSPKWYTIPTSHATVMAALLANNVYNTSHLFYSDNMALPGLESDPRFQSPWLYRSSIEIEPLKDEEHAFLITNGITSMADVWFNGVKIVSCDMQRGSYTGGRYDVSRLVNGDRKVMKKEKGKGNEKSNENVVLIQAYPTNYLRDFAQGFIDWNPYPADNGTGVWRDVEVKRTGSIVVSDLRVVHDYRGDERGIVNVTVKVEVESLSDSPVRGILQGYIEGHDGVNVARLESGFQLEARKSMTVSVTVPVQNARMWWPALWGSQPLYTVHLNVSLAGSISDVAKPARFGIRHVSSKVNKHNDTEFSVNGYPFRVRGAGYAPDLFLRFDGDRVRTMFRYMLDMGLNTVRLEGNQEQPELYDIADELGLMIMAGWECCDKWEAWDYNEDAKGIKWTDLDYRTAYTSMLHEAAMMQLHPSLLAFLVGSDYWPDDRATSAYLSALEEMDWPTPVIASASKRGYPEALGPSGMKMDGPYDWVPPNYWSGDQYGAAFGFGSEQGAGVGTPELSSLREFLSPKDLERLWKEPTKNQYHMSRYDSSFYNRAIYNKALFARYGRPRSLEDYVRKAQMMDYEATRAEFEGFAMRQNADRPATGVVYWMLNSAWPSLHWQLFDYYLRPGGAFFGVKVGTRREHVAFDYEYGCVWLVNHGLGVKGKSRTIQVDLVDRDGAYISSSNVTTQTVSNASKMVTRVDKATLRKIRDVAFLRLILREGDKNVGGMLSRNVYWLPAKQDVLEWENTNWYTTPTKQFADFTGLGRMTKAKVTTNIQELGGNEGFSKIAVTLTNESECPAVFLHLAALDPTSRAEITPVYWSDNYVTLLPKEKLKLTVEVKSTKWMVVMDGNNVDKVMVGHN